MERKESCLISVEFGKRKAICRGCHKVILPKIKVRLQISYPHVTVKYRTKSGVPSFLLHFNCWRDNPIDFVKGKSVQSFKRCKRLQEGQKFRTVYKIRMLLNDSEMDTNHFIQNELKPTMKNRMESIYPLQDFND